MNENLHHSLLDLSYKTGSGHLPNRFLKLNTDEEVVLCGAGERASGGVSRFDGTTGYQVGVTLLGVISVEVGTGGVTIGDPVISDAVGKAVLANDFTTATGSTAVLADAATPTFEGGVLPEIVNGVALGTASAGQKVLVRLI